MLPILQIGPLTLRTPGLALLAALWVGLEVTSRWGKRRGLNPDQLYNLGFYSLVAGLAAARLGFVLLNLPAYLVITPWTQAVLAIVALSPGTEVPLFGVLAGVGLAAALMRRWRIPVLPLLDAYAPGLAILAIGLGIANLLSGDSYGVPTDLPWAINLWGERRHPTQIYFTLACAVILAVLIRQEGKSQAPGILFQLFVIMQSVAILIIEPLRDDSPVLLAGIRVWEVFALLALLASLVGFAIRTPGATAEGVN